jgi:hypothetical protein
VTLNDALERSFANSQFCGGLVKREDAPDAGDIIVGVKSFRHVF